MNDNPLTDSNPAPADLAPVLADPVAPAEPATPVADLAPIISPEDQQESDEWDAAANELFPGLTGNKKDKNEPTEPPQDPASSTTETTTAAPQDPAVDPNNPADPAESEEGAAEPADAIARRTAREQQAAIDAVRNDVRDKLFADVPTQLLDPQGKPIETVQDVMQYTNEQTGEPFTYEEAASWLIASKQNLRDQQDRVNSEVTQVADTQLDLKDQADIVNYEYGELLKAMPELRQQIWEDYEATVIKDPKSGIITKAPVSLQRFYERALEPYADLGRKLAEETATTPAPVAAPVTPATPAAPAQPSRTQVRQDRSDIYGPGKVDLESDEDKEWGAAAQAVFGDQLK